ncbi:fimbrial protein [Comamonas testosteroni]|uniref:Putative major fimbrial protein SthE n=1 Tax=Comamonas testosteroni TaxID=285 RepID=A0A8B4S7D6_COMTE|nr:fimbrial protein [Comamonas testosteroni]EHN65611.1 putative fimbrial adhesin precursor [Comamonas testosteroni ATCC 11996]QQN68382.1 type 1 fimbrial protein [Comamonas testosteroni]SUY78363.1 putative major fimbrial protein SthE [Comamonas testosteroni]
MRIFLLLIALLWGPSALAQEGCTFAGSSQKVQATVALPSTLSIPRNAPNGTPLWDSGWKGFSGANTIDCSAGRVRGSHAGGIGAAVPGHISNGFSSVFATNVPGIGVSVFWCNQMLATCNPNPALITPLPSLAWPVEARRYLLNTNWRVRLIKTDDIDVSAGVVTIGGTSAVSYNHLVVTTLSLIGSSQITGLGCEVNADSRSIDVRLPTIAKTDFDASPIPRANDKAKAFNINLLCDSGVKVSYQVDGTQTSAGSNVLVNSSGKDMASGVGVALFKGDLSSITQLQLGSKFLHTTTSSGNTPVKIPLTARYFRTAASLSAMGSGLVSTTAFFTLFYE